MKLRAAISLLALVGSCVLAGCGGGGGDGSPTAPAPTWSSPQSAPSVVSGSIQVFSDGDGGVFVVGGDPGDSARIVVQRFAPNGGWVSQASLSFDGLEELQLVAIDQGFAMFGRDDVSWYRQDYTVAGLGPMAIQFPVERANPSIGTSITKVGFSRAHDGAMLATAVVSHDPDASFAQLREFRNGAWSAPEEIALVFADAAFPLPPSTFPLVNRIRTKDGNDVATVHYSQINTQYTYVALRRPGEARFTPTTGPLCFNSARCGKDERYKDPVPEQDGSATVIRDTSGVSVDWLAANSNPATSLLPPTFPTASPLVAQRLRGDGTPVWLANVTTGFSLWEGAAQAEWTTPDLTPCLAANCTAQFSTPDVSHVATLRGPTLFVSDRASAARWSNSATIDLTALLAGSVSGSTLVVVAYQSSSAGQLIVGALTPPFDPQAAPQVRPFALTKL